MTEPRTGYLRLETDAELLSRVVAKTGVPNPVYSYETVDIAAERYGMRRRIVEGA